MPDVGINVKMTSNISQVALQDSQALRNIGRAAEEMKSALQLGDLEQKYRAFAERVDKIYDLQQRNKRELAGQKKAEQGIEQKFQTVHTGITQFIKTGGGVTQRLGQTGDAVGAGIDVIGTLGDIVKELPVGGKIAAAAMTVVGGGAFIGNALAKQYEKVLPVVMDVTAALGKLGETAKESSMAFKTTMEEVAGTASKFGYSLEEGAKVFRGLAEAGAKGELKGDAEKVMAYARGYGASPELLSRYEGMGRRFGMKGNLLGIAAGALDQAGMGEARYQELLNSTLSIFEEGLSRGIVKGFKDINATQVWLSQLGELFKGQTGLQIYRQMESSIAGATSLANDKDIIMFRAARKLAGEDASYIDVMKKLEGGLNAEIFSKIKEEVMSITGEHNKVGQIELFRKIFGVTYGLAEKLLGLGAKEAVKEIKEAPKVTETDEVKVLKAQLNIMERLREIGDDILSAKAWVLEGADKVVNGLAEALGAKATIQKAEQEKKHRLEGFLNNGGQSALNIISDLIYRGYDKSLSLDELSRRGSINMQIANAVRGVVQNPDKYSPAVRENIKEFINWFGNLPKEKAEKIKSEDLFVKASQAARSADSAGGTLIVASELKGIYERLIEALNNLKVSVEETNNSDMTIEYQNNGNTHIYGLGSMPPNIQSGGTR